MANFVHTMTLKKNSTTKKQKETEEEKMRNKSETNIMDLLSHFLPNQRPHFQNSFS